MDKVSIVLPLYNCEKYVRHTIKSVQDQDYENWELIIVNDASTDASLAEAEKFAVKDPRIKIISLERNVGAGAARNVAVQNASGRYIAFIDSDDLWAKEKLSHQIAFMQNHNAPLSHTAFAFINEEGKIAKQGESHVDEKINMKRYMKTSQIRIPSVIIDRKQVSHIYFPEDRALCEDARLWMHYFRKGQLFYGLDQVLLLIRIRPDQLSRRKDKMAFLAFKRFMNEKSLSKTDRILCFLNYAGHAVNIWRHKRNVDIDYIKHHFNCNSR